MQLENKEKPNNLEGTYSISDKREKTVREYEIVKHSDFRRRTILNSMYKYFAGKAD